MLTDFLIVVALTVGALYLLYRWSNRLRGLVDEEKPLKCECGKLVLAYENSIKDIGGMRHNTKLCQPKREVIA